MMKKKLPPSSPPPPPPPPPVYSFLHLLLLSYSLCWSTVAESSGSIVFTTNGRPDYNFDIYSLPISTTTLEKSDELRLTDAKSVNFNGQFVSPSSSSHLVLKTQSELNPIELVYVTERGGASSIYIDTIYPDDVQHGSDSDPTRIQKRIVPDPNESVGGGGSDSVVSMKDRPTVVNDTVVYVSTHEDPGVPRFSWAAVYSTDLATGSTKRLTPIGQTDFSPAVSPSGLWTAVASYGEGRGWDGEIQELNTDIYVLQTRDGSTRFKLVEHGGWPSWADDDSTLFFHRKSQDGWWSVYRTRFQTGTGSVQVERVTPPGVHAFTPAAVNQTFIAVATSRPESEFRHVEFFNLEKNEFVELTRLVNPNSHHFNPFVSPDRNRVGYHRCRGLDSPNPSKLVLESLRSPSPGVSLLRLHGSFPSISPDGDQIAFVEFPGVYVINVDGTGLKQVSNLTAFATSWNPVQKGVIYTSVGPTFASVTSNVDVVAINFNGDIPSYKKLTTNGENNAFPSPSPDGKQLVFRSSRSGFKNLYIMDSIDGERKGIFRLTEGEWTDTMCNWSPDGDWIAFASDRDNPGSGSFELYLIHPNRTGLRKLIASGSAGRANHPWFSPDGRHVVFTSDYAGVSAEPISNPHHYQPYGDLFMIGVDGTGLLRLTHNSYEDGTPTWAPKYLGSKDVVGSGGLSCDFDECHWLKGGPKLEMFGNDAAMGYGYTAKAQCG